jgi:hypothetical protein
LEIGDRTSSDRVTYPDDDLVAQNSAKGWILRTMMANYIKSETCSQCSLPVIPLALSLLAVVN